MRASACRKRHKKETNRPVYTIVEATNQFFLGENVILKKKSMTQAREKGKEACLREMTQVVHLPNQLNLREKAKTSWVICVTYNIRVFYVM